MTSCTTGFTVRNTNTGNRSVVTAAHCGTAQRYARWDPADACCSHDMNFRGEVHTANADLAWFGTPAHTPAPRFYGGIRVGDGSLQQGIGIAAVGSHLCHQGKTTDYSCGGVTSTNYQPTYAGACPGGPCNSSFVRVFGTNLKNSGGDSGGPWFSGTYIYGAHKGGTCGECAVPGDTAWYSKIGYLPSQQSLLTS